MYSVINSRMSPLVSVIIPVFNVKLYLKESLDSVINQSYSNLEIIIIDDGSTDGSGELCDKYKQDSRVIIVHQDNKGLSAARNIGLDIMTGEYVTFLDSDDAYRVDFIETMLDCMIRDNLDIVVSKYSIYHGIGKMKIDLTSEIYPDAKKGLYNKSEALNAIYNGQINPSVWNKLYKRELWDEIRFPYGHNYEDVETIYRIVDLCESVFILDEILYFYRKRIGSITETITPKNIQDRILAFVQEELFITSHIPSVFNEYQLKKSKQEHLKYMISHYIQAKDGVLMKELENQITKLGKEIGLEGMSFRIRTAYQLACSAPWLLKIAYSIYLPFRLLIRRVTGR